MDIHAIYVHFFYFCRNNIYVHIKIIASKLLQSEQKIQNCIRVWREGDHKSMISSTFLCMGSFILRSGSHLGIHVFSNKIQPTSFLDIFPFFFFFGSLGSQSAFRYLLGFVCDKLIKVIYRTSIKLAIASNGCVPMFSHLSPMVMAAVCSSFLSQILSPYHHLYLGVITTLDFFFLIIYKSNSIGISLWKSFQDKFGGQLKLFGFQLLKFLGGLIEPSHKGLLCLYFYMLRCQLMLYRTLILSCEIEYHGGCIPKLQPSGILPKRLQPQV